MIQKLVYLLTLIGLVGCHVPGKNKEFIPLLTSIPEESRDSNYIQLGEQLFFDPILSLDYSISCASCHKPSLAFSDSVPISPGVSGRLAQRNAPSLVNIIHQTRFFMDGGATSIENQVIAPITDSTEMALPLDSAIQRIKNHPKYASFIKQNLGLNDKQFLKAIVYSLGAYTRSLRSSGSAFDHMSTGKQDWNDDVQKGYELFMSDRLNCGKCHTPPLFSNLDYRQNGFFETYPDSGRMRITLKPEDRGKFKVPSLRNCAITAPYMHNGSISSLEEVLELYSKGGSSFPYKDSLIHPFELTNTEKNQILSFLESLTDEEYKN